MLARIQAVFNDYFKWRLPDTQGVPQQQSSLVAESPGLQYVSVTLEGDMVSIQVSSGMLIPNDPDVDNLVFSFQII